MARIGCSPPYIALFVALAATASSSGGESQFEYPYVLHAEDTVPRKSWSDANDYCASTYGTTLATIRNDAEAQLVMDMVLAANCGDNGSNGYNANQRNTWIGLRSPGGGASSVWASGYECPDDDCDALSWWQTGQPNAAWHPCATASYKVESIDEMLHDVSCHYTYCFICDLPTTTANPDEVLFSADGPFQPSWGTSVGTVDIRDSMHYEFDIEIHSFPTTHIWSNILFIGNRLPELHIDEEFNFVVGFRDGAGSGVWSSVTYGDGMLEVGETYHLEFDWDQDWIRGTINGEVAVDEACGGHAVLEDQIIYISHPSTGWGEADVSVSNILITAPTTATAHYVARGYSNSGHFTGDVVSYCQDDENNQALYWSSRNDFDGVDFGYNIGVRCCKDEDDGTVTGYSPDCDAYPATFEDAVRVCTEDNDYRLCTRDEMDSDITKGTGCRFNHVYSWTSDECQSAVSANAAAAVSGGAATMEEANETNSAGNGLDDWMTMLIGAVIGVTVTGAVVVFVMLLAKRRKRAAEERETEMSKAVPEHVVPDMSTSAAEVPATTSGATVEV